MPPAAGVKDLRSGPSPTLKKYTWKDVVALNSPSRVCVCADGCVYDITPFLTSHPGGKEMLLLCAGRDVTEMLDMYHPFSYPEGEKVVPGQVPSNANHKPRRILAQYQIGVLEGKPEFPRFAPDRGFYRTLSARVAEHMRSHGKDPKSATGGFLRMIPVFIGFALSYAVANRLLLPDASFGVRLAAAVVFGFCQVLPLLHVMHDASHTAIGSTESSWKAWGRLASDWMAGSNMMSWHHQHIVGHHVYTNVYEADPDLPLATGDVRHLVPRQVWTAMYKWQWLYLPFAYGLLSFKSRISDITETVIARTNGPIRVNAYNNLIWRVVVPKIAWVIWRVVLPLAVFGVQWREFLACLLISELIGGYWLAFNFQVSHITTDVIWPNGIKPEPNMGDSWAMTQVKTSLDYGHGSAIQAFICGALNYQIEHHLFPGVSQYHYPAIAPIVKQTCEEFGLPYRYEKNFFHALKCHWQYLRDMSAQGKHVHMD